jgi:hypothetical protein
MSLRITLPFLLCLLLGLPQLHAQFKLYESSFNGGVVTGGYSNGATVPSGSGSFNVTIPGGSTIRQAYLIAGRCGAAPNVTVTLNGTPYTFSSANMITTGFSTIYGGISAVHAIDITAGISAATSAYTIAVPVQNTVSDKYPEFYLYIAFNNASLPVVTSAIFLNTANLNVSTYNWTLSTTAAVTNGSPVGLAVLGGYATTASDCEQVVVNGTNVGAFGGQDFNASSQWGCMAGFQYYNSALTGYNDDMADQAISGTDALSNIQALIPASTNSIPVTFNHCGGGGDNHVWSVFLTWSSTILDGKVIDFQAAPMQDQVMLRWETSDEQDIADFVVERSHNGQDFAAIGEVHSLGTVQGQTHQWPDQQPITGISWYRLRTIGSDGLASLSAVREVHMAGPQAIAAGLGPNPLPRGADLHLEGLQGSSVSWTIYSLGDGRQLLQGTISDALQATLPTSQLAAGAYSIQLRSGSKAQSLRFVVE